MKIICRNAYFLYLLAIIGSNIVSAGKYWLTTDDLENHISPEDINEFLKWNAESNNSATSTPVPQVQVYADFEETATVIPVPDIVDCFGLGSLTGQVWLFNMRPDSSDDINTHFYFSSRLRPNRVQVYPESQFGLEWVDFNPSRKTVLIVHGFMSHSNASWVLDMTKAFLEWEDVNVIAADWSKGGNTWKYWRAVANTRRVGSDIIGFMKQLITATGARVKDFHFVGHSLGAHIVSYVSIHIGRVARITGLDPAQPCFRTSNRNERLDETDADFVDVIHTNGRLLQRIGFGLPDPIGHADFYPNGGMEQPGCGNKTKSIWARLWPISPSSKHLIMASTSYMQSRPCVLLFTESLINDNCTFRAHQWDLTYEGVNTSLLAPCSRLISPCSVMGIRSVGGRGLRRADGAYFVMTSEKQPYCQFNSSHLLHDLLRDLRHGFRLNQSTKVKPSVTPAYADPDLVDYEMTTISAITTTTAKSWFRRLFSLI